MKGLMTTSQLLKEKQTNDPDSIIDLSLNHRALSDVSCLSDLKNLEKLDLRFNNLTSLEGLKSCVNLKWLSVVENKLQSLKGIEGLSKLTVLNAGKNKLRSMDEVKSIASLRALILNDNEISSICSLDLLKELNTLVLSRNQISEIGKSLSKLKNITKVSLSNCQIQTIGSSFKSCTELRELRLAHNDIKALPAELSYNKNIQNLDLGNNAIVRWSDLKVLDSLLNLKNLNLQGNPIADGDKLAKKVRKLLPNLHTFNARPLDMSANNEGADDAPIKSGKKQHERKKLDLKGQDSKDSVIDQNTDGHTEKEEKQNIKKRHGNPFEKEKESTDAVRRKSKKTKINKVQDELDIIDDAEASFTELFAAAATDSLLNEENDTNKAIQDTNMVGGLVSYPAKRKKAKKQSMDVRALGLSSEVEVGVGGPSTWE